MKTPTDEVERLNLAAGLFLFEEFFSRFRWHSLLIIASSLFLLRNSNGLVFTLALQAIFVMVAFLPKWRFKLYIPAVWSFVFGIVCLLSIVKTSHTRATAVMQTFMFAMMAYSLFKLAGWQVTVDSPTWEKERSQVQS